MKTRALCLIASLLILGAVMAPASAATRVNRSETFFVAAAGDGLRTCSSLVTGLNKDVGYRTGGVCFEIEPLAQGEMVLEVEDPAGLRVPFVFHELSWACNNGTCVWAQRAAGMVCGKLTMTLYPDPDPNVRRALQVTTGLYNARFCIPNVPPVGTATLSYDLP